MGKPGGAQRAGDRSPSTTRRRWGGTSLALALALLLWGCAEAPGRPPHILFLLIDTLRADHLGAYGYARPTSPNLDRIAREGILFERVGSVAPWTNPTIATLFTGHYPQAVLAPARHRDAIQQALPLELDTLAERLQRAGYQTVALVDHPGINPQLHYSQGFERFEALFAEGGFPIWGTTDAGFVLGRVEEVLAASGEAPVFLYLHLVYPHWPYDPPAPYDRLFGPGYSRAEEAQREGLVNRYDAEIRYTDDFVGRLYRRLAVHGWLDEGYLLVTSDHGEGFWEHGRWEHGNSFYEEVLHVPLILRPPGGLERGVRVPTPVSNVDVHPTVLEMAGLVPPAGLDGTSLLPLTAGDAAAVARAEARMRFSESPHSGNVLGAAGLQGPYKYILYQAPGDEGGPRERVFRLDRDPEERLDLGEQEAARRKALRLELLEHRERSEARRGQLESLRREPDAETRARLRALGYVD